MIPLRHVPSCGGYLAVAVRVGGACDGGPRGNSLGADLAAPHANAANHRNAQMTPVGFEPTQLALVELESTPLDHSGKVSLQQAPAPTLGASAKPTRRGNVAERGFDPRTFGL